MNPTGPHVFPDPVSEVHRRIERNLLVFQGIETSIRFMLPYLGRDGRPLLGEEFRKFNDQRRNWTLGPLMKAFTEAIRVSQEFWTLAPDQLVNERNDLVHNFYRNPAVDLMSLDGIGQALAYLDRQFAAVQELHEFVRLLSAGALLAVLDSKTALTAEEQEWRARLMASLPGNMEFVDQEDPSKTTWRTTRIVQLLKLAEAETEPVDGMTLLSRAGAFLKQRDPDANPRAYGLKRLSEVLRVSGLFDVHERGADSGSGTIILYSSKKPGAVHPE